MLSDVDSVGISSGRGSGGDDVCGPDLAISKCAVLDTITALFAEAELRVGGRYRRVAVCVVRKSGFDDAVVAIGVRHAQIVEETCQGYFRDGCGRDSALLEHFEACGCCERDPCAERLFPGFEL